ncbi:DUF4192 domain-containing protein [Dactylosporangium sp. NPDC005555]|uniref:DUF4192 domain-containing protein n=1 Tax=Dactylosporangium sp. NPDC005555 TaxID=3154889 RepID=UPI0033BFB6DF
MTEPHPRWQLESIPDLLTAVPHLLNTDPAGSAVVIGFRDQRIHLVARLDLPDPADLTDLDTTPGAAPTLTQTLDILNMIAAECSDDGSRDVVVVGYGDAEPVQVLFELATTVCTIYDLTVRHLVRVTEDQYVEHDPHLPAAATRAAAPFTPPARTGTPSGTQHPASPGPDLAAAVAPVTGDAAAAMRTAFAEVRSRLRTAILDIRLRPGTVPPQSTEEAVAEALRRLGRTAVDAAAAVSEQGGTLDDDAAAELIVLVGSASVLGIAHQRTATDDDQYLRMWLDLTRRAAPGFVAGPACLAACAAWRTNQPELARVAVTRALDDDPHGTVAVLAHLLIGTITPDAAPQ